MSRSNCDRTCKGRWSTRLLGALPALAAAALCTAGDGPCSAFPCNHSGTKVLICHVPPGNRENAHTLCISANAVHAHFKHHPGDHCAPCDVLSPTEYAGDASGDGFVGVDDLLQVLGSWGTCPDACAADLDEDGSVGISDLLTVVMNWD